MSPLSAQIISAITAAILLLAIGVPIIRRKLSGERGISTAGFDRRDLYIGVFLILFYSITPLTAFCSVKPEQAASPAAEATLTAGKILVGVLVQLVVMSSIIMRLASRNIAPQVGWKRFISSNQAWLIVLAVFTPFICLAMMEATGFSAWIAQLTNSPMHQESVKQLQNGSIPVKITLAFTAVICAPFIEELGFRGYLYPLLKKFSGPVFSCIITSLLFGIVHMNLVMLLPLSLLGVLLVITYERTRSIWAPIATHMVFNLITVVNILFIGTDSLS